PAPPPRPRRGRRFRGNLPRSCRRHLSRGLRAALPRPFDSTMVQGLASDSPSARITVVFLLYRAAREVPGLVEALLQQRHPSLPDQAEWLEALFMEDASG